MYGHDRAAVARLRTETSAGADKHSPACNEVSLHAEIQHAEEKTCKCLLALFSGKASRFRQTV